MKNIAQYKKYVINTLIFSLIAAALVAIGSIIVGSFGETSQRIVWILASIVTHALVSVALIERTEEADNSFDLFKNTLYALIPVSIVTSVLGITTVISAGLTGSLYWVFTVIVGVSLYSNILQLFKGATKLIDRIVLCNIFFVCASGILLLPQIFLNDPRIDLGEVYYRILAAVGIVDVTLTVLTLIYYKIYVQHHPEAKKITQLFNRRNGKTRVWVILLVIFVLLQVVPALIYALASLFSNNNF